MSDLEAKLNINFRQYLNEDGLEFIHASFITIKDDDIIHKACCWCCIANCYAEFLYRKDNEYIVKRYGITHSEDNDGEDVFCYSHDILKQPKHPYIGYKKVIQNNTEHPYYKFLRKNNILGKFTTR